MRAGRRVFWYPARWIGKSLQCRKLPVAEDGNTMQ